MHVQHLHAHLESIDSEAVSSYSPASKENILSGEDLHQREKHRDDLQFTSKLITLQKTLHQWGQTTITGNFEFHLVVRKYRKL